MKRQDVRKGRARRGERVKRKEDSPYLTERKDEISDNVVFQNE
jgi:hypothetical protein